MQDEWGRPLSPDGAWVWDGTQWVPHQPAQAAAPQAAAPQAVGPQEAGPGGPADGGARAALEAELQRYPRTWRMARQGVMAVADLLDAGEVVHRTAGGNGALILPGLSAAVGGPSAQRSLVVVATDRRLLFCQLTLTARKIARSQGLRYEDVTSWQARKRFLFVQGRGGVTLSGTSMDKTLLLELRAVVEPRLVNATLDVR